MLLWKSKKMLCFDRFYIFSHPLLNLQWGQRLWICTILSLPSACQTSAASKNRDWPGINGPTLELVTNSILLYKLGRTHCYFDVQGVPWEQIFWRIFLRIFEEFLRRILWQIFLDEFFDELLWRFDEHFDEFFYEFFLTIFLTNF